MRVVEVEKKKKWRLRAEERANGSEARKKRKKLECAFQTTLSTLARSRVSPRRALRARTATLSAGEEGGTERGRRRATIRKMRIELKKKRESRSKHSRFGCCCIEGAPPA
jgi:hypothetical protein